MNKGLKKSQDRLFELLKQRLDSQLLLEKDANLSPESIAKIKEIDIRIKPSISWQKRQKNIRKKYKEICVAENLYDVALSKDNLVNYVEEKLFPALIKSYHLEYSDLAEIKKGDLPKIQIKKLNAEMTFDSDKNLLSISEDVLHKSTEEILDFVFFKIPHEFQHFHQQTCANSFFEILQKKNLDQAYEALSESEKDVFLHGFGYALQSSKGDKSYYLKDQMIKPVYFDSTGAFQGESAPDSDFKTPDCYSLQYIEKCAFQESETIEQNLVLFSGEHIESKQHSEQITHLLKKQKPTDNFFVQDMYNLSEGTFLKLNKEDHLYYAEKQLRILLDLKTEECISIKENKANYLFLTANAQEKLSFFMKKNPDCLGLDLSLVLNNVTKSYKQGFSRKDIQKNLNIMREHFPREPHLEDLISAETFKYDKDNQSLSYKSDEITNNDEMLLLKIFQNFKEPDMIIYNIKISEKESIGKHLNTYQKLSKKADLKEKEARMFLSAILFQNENMSLATKKTTNVRINYQSNQSRSE